MPDSERSLNEANSGTSQVFTYTALALYGAFLFGLAEVLVSGKSFDSYWLLASIQTLINQSILPLLGACLLLIGARRHPENDQLWSWLLRTRHWAAPVCLGLLLLMPLQLLVSVTNVIASEATPNRELAALRSAQQEMVRDGQRVTPTLELGPLLTLPSGDRTAVIETIDQALALRESQQRQRIEGRLPRLILAFLHVALQSLLLCLAYAAVAMRDPMRGNLLQQLQSSWLRASNDYVSRSREQQEDREDRRNVMEQQRALAAAQAAHQASQSHRDLDDDGDDPFGFDHDDPDDDDGDEGVWSRSGRRQHRGPFPGE